MAAGTVNGERRSPSRRGRRERVPASPAADATHTRRSVGSYPVPGPVTATVTGCRAGARQNEKRRPQPPSSVAAGARPGGIAAGPVGPSHAHEEQREGRPSLWYVPPFPAQGSDDPTTVAHAPPDGHAAISRDPGKKTAGHASLLKHGPRRSMCRALLRNKVTSRSSHHSCMPRWQQQPRQAPGRRGSSASFSLQSRAMRHASPIAGALRLATSQAHR